MPDDAKTQDDAKAQGDAKVEDSSEPKQAAAKIGIVTWAILAVVVVLCAGSGFVLGRLFAGSSSPDAAESSQENSKTKEKMLDGSKTNSKDTWYYNDLESVVVNPDEPGATRYIRVGLVLEISSELDEINAKKIIKDQKPPLINWLNLYFKSLTLDEMENERDMKRILLHICDSFNEILFPDGKPHIKKILIREFNIQ